MSDVVLGQYGDEQNEIIYAVFTTPENSIPGSAVCAFSMRDILDSFEGEFKGQEDMYSQWLKVPDWKVPKPRPGTCLKKNQTLPRESVNFVHDHPLMHNPVESYHESPVFLKASFE